MKKTLKTIALWLFTVSLLTGLSSQATELQPLPADAIEEFVTVLEQIKQNYVAPKEDQALIDAAIMGMVSSLDEHSRYLTKQQLQTFERNVGADQPSAAAITLEPLGKNIAHLKLPFFYSNTDTNVRRLLQAQDELAGLIIDLRGNGGGFLDAAVAVADLFLDNKLVVRSRGRVAEASRDYRTSSDTPYTSLPLLVLIDGSTASAAEILSAALQDHHRAIIAGSRSYGKGTVQSLIYTHQGAIQMTTSLNFRPSGRAIQELGIIPDHQLLMKGSTIASMKSLDDPGHAKESSIFADSEVQQKQNDPWLTEALHILAQVADNS